jgi:hypothetical protein
MNTKSIFTIVAIVAAIGMLGMTAVAIPSLLQAHADKGGFPNSNAGSNYLKHCDKTTGPGGHTAFS